MAEAEEAAPFSDKRVFECDRYGIYYTDDTGNRIYEISGKNFIAIDGKLVQIEWTTDGRLEVVPKLNENEKLLSLIVESVGQPLKRALGAIYMQRPDDPVEYLVKSLLDHRLSELRDLLDEWLMIFSLVSE